MFRRERAYPNKAGQDAMLDYLRTVPLAELRERIRDKEFRYTADAVFQAWRMRTQIRGLRIKRGLTQEQLGALCGLRQSQIARLETMYAPVDVRVKTLRRIARALDVRLSLKFVGWITFLVDVFNMKCHLIPKTFEEEFGDPST